MAAIKSYTDLEQSKKLAEILPVESADMWYAYYYDAVSDISSYEVEPLFHKPVCNPEQSIPCWSLAALLKETPSIIDNGEENGLELHIKKEESTYYLYYLNVIDGFIDYGTNICSNLIDACYEMILKLHEQNLL